MTCFLLGNHIFSLVMVMKHLGFTWCFSVSGCHGPFAPFAEAEHFQQWGGHKRSQLTAAVCGKQPIKAWEFNSGACS